MEKVCKYFLILMLFVFCLLVNTKSVNATTVILKDSSGNYYYDYSSKLSSTYYQSLEGVLQEDFRSELHNIISSGEIKKYSYSSVTDLLKELDEDPNNKDNILCILTGRSMSKSSFGGSGRYGWNREHIWPKAHGFNSEQLAPYTDLHHLRAAEAYTNSTFHNDYDYGMVLNNAVLDEYGNKYVNKTNSSTGFGIYEPRDAVKGDIARMIMYMDIRYEGDSLSSDINLTITSGASEPSSTNGYIGDYETLISWHENDPVDDLERERNDSVYILQGNRNPFIDHPEYANIIYDANYDILEDDEYRVLYYVNDGEYSYFDNNHYKLNEKLNKPNTEPISSRYDYIFDGWALQNGQTFNFETDTITSNLKLYAKWKHTPLPATSMFERNQTLSALHLSYQNVDIDETPVVEKTTVNILSSGGSVSSIKKNTSYNFDEHLEYNKNDLILTYESNNKTSGFVGKNMIKLYPGGGNGTGLRVSAREGSNAKILDITYRTNFSGSIDSSLKKTIAEDGSYAYLQNIINATSGSSNQIEITSLEITYYVDTISKLPVFQDVSLVFGIEISKDIYADLLESGNEVFFGLILNDESKEVQIKELENCYRITSKISVSDYNKIYTARLYVMVDGVMYYTSSVSNSVSLLAQNYIVNHISNSDVFQHRIALKYLFNN